MCNKSACHNVYNPNTSLHLIPWHVNEEGDNDIITGLEGLEKIPTNTNEGEWI